ncbi:PP2C family protein-serine/threonine phosphatase [Streptantibioticus parmotrematis]|uniref:PP2C family protein-serine/threonine phosphatase n=1 Tax=Streptantibioticus parmotrematis TaxID=2873249 RepID=UPI0033D1C669
MTRTSTATAACDGARHGAHGGAEGGGRRVARVSLGRAALARALTGGRASLRQALVLVLPALWTGAVVALEAVVPGGPRLVPLLAATPAVACAGSGRRRCVLLGGACALLGLLPFSGLGRAVDGHHGAVLVTRAGTALAVLTVMAAGCLVCGRRTRLADELERVREVAVAAQQTLVRPLPHRVGGFGVAGAYLPAQDGAQVGGDLYDVLATPYGVRVVLGDVRGHGLPALATVAALLAGFREAAHEEPGLDGVLRRLERSMARHLRERAQADHPAAGRPGGGGQATVGEEFATVLLLQVRRDGTLTALNCGHPWPHRVRAAPGRPVRVTPLSCARPMAPLGVLDPGAQRPRVQHGKLRPGEALFLHTDGAEDARDAAGEFFALPAALEHAAGNATTGDGSLAPERLVAAVRDALLRHAGGRPADDVALLALRRDPAHADGRPASRPTDGTAELSCTTSP